MTYELEETDAEATDVVLLAERHLELAMSALSEQFAQMTAGPGRKDDEVRSAALEVVAALRMLIVLRTRIEIDERRSGGSGQIAQAIDLEDARTSIGRLLDRLRDEDGADEVPE